jgi:glycosyltransferase involved in cell wall biosynthesis
MNKVLLTVSGTIPADIQTQIDRGLRPEADYVAMAREFGADLLDYAAARQVSGRFGRALEKIGGPNLLLAYACYRLRRRYRVIFTDGEQVGLPLAALLKFSGGAARPRHLMIVHILSVGKKRALIDALRPHSHIDTFFVYSTWQQQFIQQRWKLAPERVVFTPFMVDADFFAPQAAARELVLPEIDPHKPLLCAVGLEFRDYPTLLTAVRDLDVQLVIAAASPWSKRRDSTADQEIPANVLVRRFSQHELRDLYAMSRFVVMPLVAVNFQAGVTAILEALAMARAVICTRTPGQTDVIIDGETGLYVPPADPHALREAIADLLAQPEEAARMGHNGRRLIEEQMSLAHYTKRLNRYVQHAKES